MTLKATKDRIGFGKVESISYSFTVLKLQTPSSPDGDSTVFLLSLPVCQLTPQPRATTRPLDPAVFLLGYKGTVDAEGNRNSRSVLLCAGGGRNTVF